jgi:hypothetical protein
MLTIESFYAQSHIAFPFSFRSHTTHCHTACMAGASHSAVTHHHDATALTFPQYERQNELYHDACGMQIKRRGRPNLRMLWKPAGLFKKPLSRQQSDAMYLLSGKQQVALLAAETAN